MIDFSTVKSIVIPEGEVAMIARGSEILWQKQTKKYKRELLYLESTGKQWIDTGIIGDRDCAVELKVYITGNINNGCGLGSWGANTGTERAWLFYTFGNTFRCGYGDTNVALPYTAELNTWYKWKIDVVDNKQIIFLNDEHIYTSGEKKYFTTNQNLYLFGMNNRGSFAYELKSRMKYVKIWKLGVLVRDFIPVLDMNDVPCMYDKVSGEMFYNRGTGEFAYGELPSDTRLPAEYQEVAYLESTGTQWINTGIYPTDTTIKLEVKIAYNSTSTGQLMGSGTSGNERFNFGIESSRFRFGFGGSWFNANSAVLTANTEPHVWVLDANTKTGSIDGVAATTTNTYSPTGARAVVLFARGTSSVAESGNRTKGKLYYAKIWNKGVLARDFIPCYRKSDSKPGMYDLVTETFFTNAGTGEFSYAEITGGDI